MNADVPSPPSLPFSASVQSVPFIDLKRMHEPIHDELMRSIEDVVRSQQFVLGSVVCSLEQQLAQACGTAHAVGCASGTDALILALLALGIGPGDEVITSPFTFFATAGAIVRVGARPVFVDIDPQTFNIDPAAVEAAITRRTAAIVPVHLFGQLADMPALTSIADRHGLAVVEDACQAIGATLHGRPAGSWGDVGCFSLFPTKNLGAFGDGGFLTTNNAHLAGRLRQLRVHGDAGGYNHQFVGINSRLDALQAAIVQVKLRRLPEWTRLRQQNARRYAELFAECGLDQGGEVSLPFVRSDGEHVFNQFSLRVSRNRDDVLRQLRARGVGCTVYYPTPLHLQPCFASLGYRPGQLPFAEQAANEALALPIFPGLTAAEQRFVVANLEDIVRGTAGDAQPVRHAA
ncbi:MAG: DegT/DnrJ/EryC1/StrS family aminotransferase [Planctomycetota bacterium]|nr:MAG: DegT/DnrJ/EryC1/StrS family aminotransferase [Planctomycetota bacterium]